MKNKIQNLIFVSVLLLIGLSFLVPKLLLAQDKKVEIYFFYGQGCPHCTKEKAFLETLQTTYPQLEVKSFEIFYNEENQNIFQKIAQAYETTPRGVPMTFIGKEFVLGFDTAETTGQIIEGLIQACLSSDCPSPQEILNEKFPSTPTPLPSPTPSPTPTPEPELPTETPEPQQPEPSPEELLPQQAPVSKSPICIHYFVRENCEQCPRLLPFLEGLSQKYGIDLKVYNVSENKLNEELYYKLHDFYNLSFSGFPIVFLGDTYLLGDERIRQNLETVIMRCQNQGCPCPVEAIEATLTQMPKTGTFTPESKKQITFSLFGKQISFSLQLSLPVLGMILGLADGINPCTFSVLAFLLTYLLAIGSRKRAIKVGLVFVLGVFAIYFLFMLGMLNLITLIGLIQKIKIAVAVLALLAGLIMIKDFFFYGKWLSLEIPENAKPMIEGLIKKGTIPSALALAVLSSLVELPCTSGIPLAYVTILAQRGATQHFYLFWYNIFFVLPLILIIAVVGFAWFQVDKIEKWRVGFKKYMRLLAGLILVILSIALFKR